MGVDIEAVPLPARHILVLVPSRKQHDLTRKLTKFGGNIQFIEVPLQRFKRKSRLKRRSLPHDLDPSFMMRITDRIREVRNGLVIINGESLGQVASQTLGKHADYQRCDQHSSHSSIGLRWTSWKSLTSRRKSILLKFQSSLLKTAVNYFTPDRPKTNPKIENAEQYEKRMDVEGLVERAWLVS